MILLQQSQAQMIAFVMVDAACAEVAGLTTTYTLQVSKAGGAFAASAGAKAEIGNGWYAYTLTAGECDTIGPLAIMVTGAGAVQQNLLFFVRAATTGAVEWPYEVLTPAPANNPIEGVEVWFAIDLAGTVVVWYGVTDALGFARDVHGHQPLLDPGTYYVWRQRAGYTFDNPDTEVVS